MTTVCNQCNIEKSNDEYYSHYKSRCKQCVEANRKLKRSQKYNKNKDKKIICSVCNTEKCVKDFYASNQHTCKECVKAKTKERNEANPEKKKEDDRKWREENKERKQENDKKWRENNKERKKTKNKDNKEYQEKMKIARKNWKDRPENKMSLSIRNRLDHFLRSEKDGYLLDKYLGCDKSFYKKWLEYQFDSNMSWENYGSYWHIDHVIGCSNFESDEESLKKCFHWSNTRPLERKRNLSKSGSVFIHTNVLHSLILNQFIKENNLELDISFNAFNQEIVSKLGDKIKLRETPKDLTTTPISNE